MKQRPTDLNTFAATVHQANIKWWQNIDTGEPIQRNVKELLALIISEICECLEGERKDLMDDKLPHRKMAEVEMADAVIRTLDFAAGFGFGILEINNQFMDLPSNKAECLFDIIGLLVVGEFSQPEVPYSMSVGLFLKSIESYCHHHSYDLWAAVDEKMAFNATREDHTHEARKIAGGKQF